MGDAARGTPLRMRRRAALSSDVDEGLDHTIVEGLALAKRRASGV